MKIDFSRIKKFIKDSWIALRPLSLTLALGSTTLGILAAFKKEFIFKNNFYPDLIKIILITIAGALTQAGANLINDYFEGSFRYYRTEEKKVLFLGKERSYFDIYVFLWGLACFGAAGLIGLYLIYVTNIYMLFIGLAGIIGAYAYTGEPFVYKRKGLGAPLSFLLMGPLMLLGAYFPFAMDFSWYPIILGLPPSLIIPALMLSNEMRDFKRDNKISLGTLSVRIGHKISTRIYEILIFGAFFLVLLYVILKIYPVVSLFVFLSLPTALIAHKNVLKFDRLGIPLTNMLHWQFTLIIIITLILDLLI